MQGSGIDTNGCPMPLQVKRVGGRGSVAQGHCGQQRNGQGLVGNMDTGSGRASEMIGRRATMWSQRLLRGVMDRRTLAHWRKALRHDCSCALQRIRGGVVKRGHNHHRHHHHHHHHHHEEDYLRDDNGHHHHSYQHNHHDHHCLKVALLPPAPSPITCTFDGRNLYVTNSDVGVPEHNFRRRSCTYVAQPTSLSFAYRVTELTDALTRSPDLRGRQIQLSRPQNGTPQKQHRHKCSCRGHKTAQRSSHIAKGAVAQKTKGYTAEAKPPQVQLSRPQNGTPQQQSRQHCGGPEVEGTRSGGGEWVCLGGASPSRGLQQFTVAS